MKMTPAEALQILAAAVQRITATRQEHAAIIQAEKTLREAISPKMDQEVHVTPPTEQK